MVRQRSQRSQADDDPGASSRDARATEIAARRELQSRNRFDLGGKIVAGTALGSYELWASRVRLDFSAQPQDLHVDAAIEHIVVEAMTHFQQLVAAQNPLRGFEQRSEQPELGVREIDALADG